MFRYEAATLPTRAGSGVTIASDIAPDEKTARSGLAAALAHISPRVAVHMASKAEQVFTDFPEFGITPINYPALTDGVCSCPAVERVPEGTLPP